MTTSANSSFSAQCSEIFESAAECLDLTWGECEIEADRTRIGALMNECAAFVEIKAVLIDFSTGKFSNTETLNAVVVAIQNIALNVFGDRFPIQRFRAIDLAIRLAEAGSRICLYDVSDDEPTIH